MNKQNISMKRDLSQQISYLYNENLEELILFREKFTPKLIKIAEKKIDYYKKLVNL